MKIHLHIGTHKTGTSAIQSFCTKNRDFLATRGIFWPEAAPREDSGAPTTLGGLVRRGLYDQAGAYMEQALSAADMAGASCLLLSSETFCQVPPEGIQAFFALLPKGCELEVIVYFRNIYDYALSSLSEMIKIRSRPIEVILNNLSDGLDYSAILRNWEAVVPGDRLHVRSYEEEKDRLIPAFFERLGISAADMAAVRPDTPYVRNASLDFPTQLMLRAIGYSSNVEDFVRSSKLYATIFDGTPIVPPMTRLVAEALCPDGESLLTHPRLAPYRAQLLARPAREPLSDTEMVDYLERLSRFTAALAELGDSPLPRRPEKKKGWAARLFGRA